MKNRIAELPRREWRELEQESVEELTAALRTANGTQILKAFQAALLREALELGGAYGMGRVGVGKTLVSLLAGEIMQEDRVLILTLGGAKAKTEHEFGEYRKNWRGVSPLKYKLLGYSDLSRFPKEGRSLNDLWGPGLGPTLIICDEADKLRRVYVDQGASGLALQVNDYLATHPECKMIALTGTPDKSSIKDYAHILQWSLRDGSPLPTDPGDLEDWSEVIDRGDMRCAKKVCRQMGIAFVEDVDAIRAAYHERLRLTPGVVISDDQFEGPLQFKSILLPPWGMEEHFNKLRKLWQRPDGWDLSPDAPDEDEERRPDRVTGGSMWSCARQMSLGFCYVADPIPPLLWMDSRRLYFKAVRSALRNRFFYTEQQFRHAAARGELKPAWQHAYEAWEEMRPTFTPGSKCLWLSDHALDFCEEWGQQPGIIWVDYQAFGVELEKRTGWRYFQGGGKDRRGKPIEKASSSETIIASRPANSTARNLQKPPHGWHRNLCTSVPANNRDFEQMVGRTHRDDQPFPVTFEILVSCKEHLDSIGSILFDARRQNASVLLQKAINFPWAHAQNIPKGIFFDD